jgi:hypothetical protein
MQEQNMALDIDGSDSLNESKAQQGRKKNKKKGKKSKKQEPERDLVSASSSQASKPKPHEVRYESDAPCQHFSDAPLAFRMTARATPNNGTGLW